MMGMESTANSNDCKSCRKAIKPKHQSPWLMGFLLVILPKCPFCVLAYSSTIMLCGKDSVISTSGIHYSETTVFITIGLCLLTLAGIAFNQRDHRTKYAIGLALAGSMMAILSAIYGGGEYLYYTGVLLIFTGVWLNGSLLYVIHRMRSKRGRPAY
jgi:uncharacterized protein YqgC (DUF456 family)